jgi:hypothetical protein
MAITLYINDVDRTSLASLPSLRMSEDIKVRGSVMEFEIWLRPDQLDSRPQPENVVELKDGTTTEFKGVILSVTEERTSPMHFKYTCRCSDWTRFINRRLVNETYTNTLFSDIVKDIIDKYVRGTNSFFSYDSTSIPDSTNWRVGEKKFEYQEVIACFDELIQEAPFYWYVDWDGKIYFKDLSTFTATFPDTGEANSYTINIDEYLGDVDASGNVVNGWGDLILEEDVSGVKNRIIVRGVKVKSSEPYYERPAVEPDSVFVPASYPIWPDVNSITFTRNGVPLNIKIDLQDGRPGDGRKDDESVYVCFENRGFRVADLSAFQEGDEIEFSYHGEEEVPALIVQDDNAIAEMNSRDGTYGDGIYEYAASRPDVRAGTWDSAAAVGKAILLREAWPVIRGSFQTYIKGFRAGQAFQFTSTYPSGNPRFPPSWFNTQTGNAPWLYITSVEKTIRRASGSDTKILYTVNFSSSRWR